MHELGPEPNFNESMYFNAYDPEHRAWAASSGSGTGPTRARGEMTLCLYLPDGRVAFMFRRPRVTDNDAFDAAGMRFEVVEPFVELRVAYEGSAVLLETPCRWPTPRRPSSRIPTPTCAVDLVYRGSLRHVRR